MSLWSDLKNRLDVGAHPTPHRPAAPRQAPKLRRLQTRAVSDSIELVDVMALMGPALVLDNGTFVRMLEVQPVDLQRGDRDAKLHHWQTFGQALRRLRAPATWQILISSRPQATGEYLDLWRERAEHWRTLSESAGTAALADRRLARARSADDTVGFLERLGDALCPMQQRYLLVIPYNPFAVSLHKKTTTRALDGPAIKTALDMLANQVKLARAILADAGVETVELDGPAMCQALWESYHHSPSLMGSGLSSQVVLDHAAQERAGGRNRAFHLQRAGYHPPARESFVRAAGDPAALAELLAPDRLEEDPSFIQVGEVYGRCYLIHDFATAAEVDLASLLGFPADVTHSLYVVAGDPLHVRERYKRKETELQANKLLNQKRGVVTDWANEAQIKAIEALRAEMEVALLAPFDLYWYAIVWANDLTALGDFCRDFEIELKRREFRFTPATRHQAEIFMAARPVGRLTYRHTPRIMSADALGACFPFVRREYMEPGGYHFGVHKGNGMLVCLDPFQGGNNNASMLLIGSQRSGKSMTSKDLIWKTVDLGHRGFVMDPEQEYLKLAVALHAPYIEIATGRERARVRIGGVDESGPAAGFADLQRQYQALTDTTLAPEQQQALADAYDRALEARGIALESVETWAHEPPLLTDVLAPLRESPHRALREVARVLAYSDPGAHTGFFNPMDLQRRHDHAVRYSAEALVSFTESIARAELSAGEFNTLVKAYRDTLALAGVREDAPDTWHPEHMPVLSQLVDRLYSQKESDEAFHLASILEQFAYDGLYAGMFNQRTTIDLSREQAAFFGMRSLRQSTDDKLAAIVTRLQLTGIQNEVFAGAGSRQPTHVVVDEARFLFAYPGAGRRFVGMSQSFPKYMAALYLIFHTAESFLANPESAMIKDLTRFKMIFRQESQFATRALAELFELTPAEQAIIRGAAKGEAMLLADNHLRIPIYNAVNLDREGVLRADSEMQAALSVALGRQQAAVV